MKPYKEHYSNVLDYYKTDQEKGLNTNQVEEILKVYGENKLKEKKKTSLIVKFFMQFNDFMIIVLLLAAGVSFFISYFEGQPDFIDSIIILFIVTLNAILGLVQENKAEKSLEALKKMSAPHAKVIRNGKVIHVDTEQLVPGDILVLETGDIVLADARLIRANNLKVEEAALTGESVPVDKDSEIVLKDDLSIGDRRNMVFSSSSISSGKGLAVVCYTGMNTEVGKIADMILSDDSPDTPLQKRLNETGKLLGIGALAICGIIFVLGLFRNIELFEIFMTSVSLAVAAIPEGLPAIVTIMLAIGVQRMADKKAIIRKLPAVETLGSANIICSDKTGTLTQNKMKVVELADANGKLSSTSNINNLILKYGALCNDSIVNENNKILGEPTESSIVVAALNSGINKNDLEKELPKVSELPFDSKRKLMTTVHKKANGKYFVVTKGAPDILVNKCKY
mgnify:CR=1 FL=1